VYHTAKKWLLNHNDVTQPNQIKLSDIRDAMDVRDSDEDAIGTDKAIITEISSEIPGADSAWDQFAFTIQSQSLNIYDEESGYTGMFETLEAFFSYIQEIARAIKGRESISGMVSRSSNPLYTSSSPTREEKVSKSKTSLVVAMAHTSEENEYEYDGYGDDGSEEYQEEVVEQSQEYQYDDEGPGDEEQPEETAEAFTTASMQGRQRLNRDQEVDRILEFTGVKRIRTDQVITPEEWQNRKSLRTDTEKDSKTGPPQTFSAMKYQIDNRYSDGEKAKLLARLKQFFQEAVSAVYVHVNKEPVMITDADMQGCRYSKGPKGGHIQRGSHTDITCHHRIEGDRTSCEGVRRLIGKYAEKLNLPLLAKKCEAMGAPKCGKDCVDTHYTRCQAQRKYYYEEIMKEKLVDEYDLLRQYTTEESMNTMTATRQSGDQLNPTELKQLIVSIVIQSFTMAWNSHGK